MRVRQQKACCHQDLYYRVTNQQAIPLHTQRTSTRSEAKGVTRCGRNCRGACAFTGVRIQHLERIDIFQLRHYRRPTITRAKPNAGPAEQSHRSDRLPARGRRAQGTRHMLRLQPFRPRHACAGRSAVGSGTPARLCYQQNRLPTPHQLAPCCCRRRCRHDFD